MRELANSATSKKANKVPPPPTSSLQNSHKPPASSPSTTAQPQSKPVGNYVVAQEAKGSSASSSSASVPSGAKHTTSNVSAGYSSNIPVAGAKFPTYRSSASAAASTKTAPHTLSSNHMSPSSTSAGASSSSQLSPDQQQQKTLMEQRVASRKTALSRSKQHDAPEEEETAHQHHHVTEKKAAVAHKSSKQAPARAVEKEHAPVAISHKAKHAKDDVMDSFGDDDDDAPKKKKSAAAHKSSASSISKMGRKSSSLVSSLGALSSGLMKGTMDGVTSTYGEAKKVVQEALPSVSHHSKTASKKKVSKKGKGKPSASSASDEEEYVPAPNFEEVEAEQAEAIPLSFANQSLSMNAAPSFPIRQQQQRSNNMMMSKADMMEVEANDVDDFDQEDDDDFDQEDDDDDDDTEAEMMKAPRKGKGGSPLVQQSAWGPQALLREPPKTPAWLQEVLDRSPGTSLEPSAVQALIDNQIDASVFADLTMETLSAGIPSLALGAKIKLVKLAEAERARSNRLREEEGRSKLEPETMAAMELLRARFHRSLVVEPGDDGLEIYYDAPLGRGGYASVFEGRLAGRPVALKCFDTWDAGMEEASIILGGDGKEPMYHKNIISILAVSVAPHRSRFMSRSSTTSATDSSPSSSVVAAAAAAASSSSSSLRSPGYCAPHSPVGVHPRFVMAMSLAEGSLHQLLSKSAKTLSFDVIVRFGLQLASALNFLHARNVLHLDIKPHNALLYHSGSVVCLCDFGISHETQRTMTQLTSMVATPLYQAPETLTSNLVAPTIDIYGTGAIFFWMVSGEEPYGGSIRDFVEQDQSTGATRVTPLLELFKPREGAPQWLVDLTKQCLDPNPALRPKNGAELLAKMVEGAKSQKELAPLVMGMELSRSSGGGGSSGQASSSYTGQSSYITGGMTEVVDFSDDMTF